MNTVEIRYEGKHPEEFIYAFNREVGVELTIIKHQNNFITCTYYDECKEVCKQFINEHDLEAELDEELKDLMYSVDDYIIESARTQITEENRMASMVPVIREHFEI